MKRVFLPFEYTYHVLPQIESFINSKTILSGSPLVEAMFMTELKNMMLTAGHDLDKIEVPLSLKVSNGGESLQRVLFIRFTRLTEYKHIWCVNI